MINVELPHSLLTAAWVSMVWLDHDWIIQTLIFEPLGSFQSLRINFWS